MKTSKIVWTSLLTAALLLGLWLGNGSGGAAASEPGAGTGPEKTRVGEGNDGSGGSAGHGDPYSDAFMTFAAVLGCAVIGRFGARKLGQSPVLGELAVGIVVGAALYQLGGPAIMIIRHADTVQAVTHTVLTEEVSWAGAVNRVLSEDGLSGEAAEKLRSVLENEHFAEDFTLAHSLLLFSSLGVILLLFMVGLECSVEEMREVGGAAGAVGFLGVAAPFSLGWLTMVLLQPDGDPNAAVFVGAALCATSIGVTARVFKDMGRLDMPEAKIVLGAAVLDDVLGLIVLAAVSGIVAGDSAPVSGVLLILLKSVLFLGAVLFFGNRLLKRNVDFFAKLDGSNVSLLYPFVLLMVFAWLSDLIGLAAIVGAFAAGLIIKEEDFVLAECRLRGCRTVEEVMGPLEGIFAPIFFVLMGFQVDASTFGDTDVLLAGLLLTAVAVAGKIAASLPLKKGADKLIVGVGLVPRGEVGLIFASIGRSLGVLDAGLFSVIIIVVLLTTLLSPPMLTWAVRRRERSNA